MNFLVMSLKMKFFKIFSSCSSKTTSIKDDVAQDSKRNIHIQVDLTKYSDCRSYEQKKVEIDDNELNNYLKKKMGKRRRNGFCEEIIKSVLDNQLIEFQIYLCRELYFKSFPM